MSTIYIYICLIPQGTALRWIEVYCWAVWPFAALTFGLCGFVLPQTGAIVVLSVLTPLVVAAISYLAILVANKGFTSPPPRAASKNKCSVGALIYTGFFMFVIGIAWVGGASFIPYALQVTKYGNPMTIDKVANASLPVAFSYAFPNGVQILPGLLGGQSLDYLVGTGCGHPKGTVASRLVVAPLVDSGIAPAFGSTLNVWVVAYVDRKTDSVCTLHFRPATHNFLFLYSVSLSFDFISTFL